MNPETASNAGFKTVSQTVLMAVKAKSTALWMAGNTFSNSGLTLSFKIAMTASRAGLKTLSQSHLMRLKAISTAFFMIGKAS